MKVTLVWIASCLLLITAVAQQRNGAGVIYGTVISQNGQPGQRMNLYAEKLDAGGQFPTTKSNDHGEYRFENLPFGRYRVVAEDHDAGYAPEVIDDSSRAFVAISDGHPEAEFRVVLPPKAGFLRIKLTNRKTGATISWMGVSLARSETPEHSFLSSTSKSSEVILVPPDRNLVVNVMADGFREWDESVGVGNPIFVPSGSQLVLDVRLDPIP
jgi:Carboxypeptidase regulatory-like domain